VAYLLAIGSAVLYGAADFTGGLTTRRASTIPVVLLSQAAGLIMLALIMPLLPTRHPRGLNVLWGAAAGLSGGIGVALLYHALATGTMAVVAPTTAVCAVAIPVVVSVLLGERPVPLAVAGIALGMVSIVLVSQQQEGAQVPTGRAGDRRAAVRRASAPRSLRESRSACSSCRSPSGINGWHVAAAGRAHGFDDALRGHGDRRRAVPPDAGEVTALVIFAGVIDHARQCPVPARHAQGPLSIVLRYPRCTPPARLLLARIVLGERLRPWQVTGVGCALAAVVLIVSGGR